MRHVLKIMIYFFLVFSDLQQPLLVSSANETREGSDILLMCNTPYQQAIISWYKDDVLYSTPQKSVLRIMNLMRDDGGSYKCQIEWNNLLRDSNDVVVNITCKIFFLFVVIYSKDSTANLFV